MQTSYLIEHVAGYEGDLADSDVNHVVIPLRNNSGADLPFGRVVVHDAGTGTSDLAAKGMATGAETVMGISVRSAARASGPLDTSGVDGVRDDDMFDCLTKGAIYVTVDEAIVAGDDVYVRFGPGTPTDASKDTLGRFGTSLDAHTAWAKNTAYSKADRVALAGKVYECITAGTSENSDSPALSGSTSADATDGTAHWKYLGVCNSTTRASCALIPGAIFRGAAAASGVGAAAGALAVVELNLPQ